MTDTLFEHLGGNFTQVGDYLLPDLTLPAEKEPGHIGVSELPQIVQTVQKEPTDVEIKYQLTN